MSDHATTVEPSPRPIAVLGADALPVALPSTPTQLANVHVEVSLAPAGEHHDADVTWGDFLAALPAALAMDPEHASAAVAGQRSCTAARRALQKKEALPRAYMAARAGARRERSALPRPSLARRASHEGMTGSRGASSPPAGLATADRWLLAGLMLASSVLVAVLTSALTVREVQPVARTAVPAVALRAQPVVVVATEPVRIDSAQERAEASGVPTPPPARRRPSPMRIVPRAERHSISLAEHTRPSLPASTIPAAPIAMPRSDPAPPKTSVSAITAPAAASPLANPAVLEELRAIHAEIDARKRHMDSLTSTLDSLNRVQRPE
ncbi:MAG TPA: hypothetical protein VLI43_04035 [Gemmatimonadaceae bacterium]|nr:hypothetical protein [Gemmatimonadaceae bacterium]